MSDEQTGTLNTESTGDSSLPAATPQTEDLIPTVDQPIPEVAVVEGNSSEETLNTEGQEEGGGDENEAAATKDGEAEPPFHEHPRFQELIREKNVLKEQLAEIQGQQERAMGSEIAEEPDYQDMGTMDNEDLQEMFEDDPKGFVVNLAKQIRAEVISEVQAETEQKQQESWWQQKQQATAKTLESYANDHPDFDTMWDEGKIQKFMDENPGHNAISAHMLLTRESLEQDALKKAEAKVMKDLRAKRNAQVLSGGPSATARPAGLTPVELKNTKKYGGLTSVLAARSAQRMRGS